MRPNQPARAQRAATALVERLNRAGVPVTAEALASRIPALEAATDRAAAMSCADGIVDTLARLGVECSKSKALEAVAAFKGARSWAALDASLKAAAPAARSLVSELLVSVRDFGGRTGFVFMHPGDCRPGAMRVVVETGSGTGGSARLMSGCGSDAVEIARAVFTGGHDEARRMGTMLAAFHEAQWRASLPSDVSRDRLDAARMLFAAGFEPIHTGGGVMLWGQDDGDVTYRIGDGGDGEDGLDVSTLRPVLLDLAEEDDETLPAHHDTLASALEAARNHAMVRRAAKDGVSAPAPRA